MAIGVFYDKLEAIVLARQYKNKTEFTVDHRALYKYANRHGWWPEMSRYMDKRVYPPKRWTREAIFAAAKTIKIKKDFQQTFPGAYAAAVKLGILIEVCSHMDRKLLAIEKIDGRNCSRCGKFTKPENIAGESAQCRRCHSERTSAHAKANPGWKASTVAKRRAMHKRAIPPWVGGTELKEIAKIYKKAREISRETGITHEVDHIYPLNSDVICGLHVIQNLQILPQIDNRRKSNKVSL